MENTKKFVIRLSVIFKVENELVDVFTCSIDYTRQIIVLIIRVDSL